MVLTASSANKFSLTIFWREEHLQSEEASLINLQHGDNFSDSTPTCTGNIPSVAVDISVFELIQVGEGKSSTGHVRLLLFKLDLWSTSIVNCYHKS